MKVLVTGSSGFIGRQLKQRLLSLGYQVVDFNSSDGDISKTIPPFPDVKHVFHLAGKSFVPDSWKDPKSFYEINVTGTLNILEMCRANGAAITFMSSYVYGIPEKLPIDENHPLNPANPYGHSKLIAEEVCLYYQKAFNVHTTILRPFNIYGANQNDKFLIPTILKQVFDERQKEIEVLDLTPRRDYLFLDDLVTAIVMLFQKNQNGIYNIGSGYSMTVRDIIEAILHVSGINKKYISKETSRKNEIPDVVADISKIKAATGWKPAYGFKEGVAEIIKREGLK